jgi:hypothetical protein
MKNKTVKELREQRADLSAKIGRINTQITELKVVAGNITREITGIDAEIARIVRVEPEPRLTDHALLRFIERVYNIDIEAIKAKIMTPGMIQAIKSGATAFTVEGAKFKIADNCIVTVISTEKQKPKGSKIRAVDELEEGLADYYEGGAT